jgi:hypothetical protein
MAPTLRLELRRLIATAFTVAVLLNWSAAARAEETPRVVDAARAEFARKVAAIAKLRPFDPKKAATILGGRLGPAFRSTEYNTRHEVTGTGPLLTATVTRTPKETSVTIRPAASVGLAFQDLENLLLDYPHEIETVDAHFNEVEQRTIAVRHWFQVPAGTLALEVWADKREPADGRKLISDAYAAARGQGSRRNLVKTIMLGDRRDDDDHRPPTLRSRRSVRQAPSQPPE